MTYLITRFASVGNIAMIVPILSSVSHRYPQHTFVVVAKKDLHDMFYGLPNVIYHEAKVKGYGLSGIIRLYRELQAYNIDAVIDLHDVLRSQLLRWRFYLAHKPVFVIRYGRWEKTMLTLRKDKNKPLPTEFQRYQMTFQKAGLESDNDFTAIPVNEEAKQALHPDWCHTTSHRIGFAPFAKRSTNLLPYRTSREIIRYFAAQPNTEIFLFGAGEIECEVLRQWAAPYPNVYSIAGVLPLCQELELMRQLHVMLCMDSANQHLASLVNLRAVTIWMGTHPAMGYLAWKQSEDDVVQLPFNCRPCTVHGTHYCRFFNYACKNFNIKDICQRLSH